MNRGITSGDGCFSYQLAISELLEKVILAFYSGESDY
jgi:hypothetical protein